MNRDDSPNEPGRPSPAGANTLICTAALITIVIIQAYEVSAEFLRFINSPLWILRPVAWTVLFAATGHGLAERAASYSTSSFLKRRLARDWAPLAVLVLAVVLVVGPLESSHTLGQYAADRGVWTYLSNLAGVPQFALPGVFEADADSRTTIGLLWAVPVYMAIVACAAVMHEGAGWRRILPAALAIVAIVLAVLADRLGLRLFPDAGFSRAEALGFPLSCALAGCGGLAWRPRRLRRRWRRALLAGLIVLGAAAGWWSSREWLDSVPFCLALAGFGIAALLTQGARPRALGERVRPWMPVIYCAWLVSYPIQQLVVLHGPAALGAVRSLVLSLPLALVAGALLWRGLAELFVRCGFADVIGDPHLPLPPLVLPRYSRAWWLARLQRGLIVAAWSLVLALCAGGLLALVLLAYQPDKVGV